MYSVCFTLREIRREKKEWSAHFFNSIPFLKERTNERKKERRRPEKKEKRKEEKKKARKTRLRAKQHYATMVKEVRAKIPFTGSTG